MKRRFGPLALALLALLGAVLACSVEFSTAHFEDAGMYATPQAEERVRVFKPAQDVYVVAQLKDAPEPVDVAAVWYSLVLDDQDHVTDAIEIDRDTATLTNGQVVFQMTPQHAAQEAWPRGKYRVELFVEGERDDRIDFGIQ